MNSKYAIIHKKGVIMLILFVTSPWPSFYKKGMKTWEIRSYPIEYRGDILLVESKTNKAICKMTLVNCITLNKELWEMNFDKHRTSCSFEELPYRTPNGNAYAWIMANPVSVMDNTIINRPNKKPYFVSNDDYIFTRLSASIQFNTERLACKFIGNRMLIYWIKRNYFALVAIVDLSSNSTQIITTEIQENEQQQILNQLLPNFQP